MIYSHNRSQQHALILNFILICNATRFRETVFIAIGIFHTDSNKQNEIFLT